MGCDDKYVQFNSTTLESLSIEDREVLIARMGKTIVASLTENQPQSSRALIDQVVELHGVTPDDAAYALLRLGGTHVGDKLREDVYSNYRIA